MKIFHKKFLVVMTLSLATTSSFAMAKPTYIQLGSFSVKSNAYRLQEMAQLKTNHPVTVQHIKKFYVVKVGPLFSATEVNATREELRMPTSQPITVYSPVRQESQHAIKRNAQTNYFYASSGKGFIAGFVGAQRPNTDSYFTVDNGSGYPSPYNLDRFSRTTNTSVNAAVEGGYRWISHQQFIPAYSLSVRYEHTFVNDIGDQVTQYSLPDFTNYTYQWNIASDIVLLMGKVDLVEWHHFMPYFSGGVGVAFNRAKNYTETALPNVTPRTSPGYTDLTTTQFAYHVGAGIDWQMSPKLIMSLGYDYQDLGKITSGDGVSSWSGTQLSSGTYHTNTVMLGLNYLFDLTKNEDN